MNKENQILVLRDNAKAELMQIKDVEDGLSYLNKMKTIEVWVKAEKKDAELQNLIAEQKLRTQRILGELIEDGQDRGEITTSGRDNNKLNKRGVIDNDTPLSPPKTLNEIGLTRNQSYTFKKIAEIPEQEFESFITEKKENVKKAVSELTTTGAVRLANEIKKRTPVTDYEKSNSLNIRLERERELLTIAKQINEQYNKSERDFIKARIK